MWLMLTWLKNTGLDSMEKKDGRLARWRIEERGGGISTAFHPTYAALDLWPSGLMCRKARHAMAEEVVVKVA